MPHKSLPLISFFGVVWCLSSIAGLAALLRSGQKLTKRLLFMGVLNSGLFGLGIAFWLHDSLSPTKLLAVSIFAGLGGMNLVELAYQIAKKRLSRLK